MSLKLEQLQAVISGLVQGVGFRYGACGQARGLGVTGWVRNLAGGEVEVFAEGSAEQLDALLKWLHQGPPGARVDRVEIQARMPKDAAAFPKFEIRR